MIREFIRYIGGKKPSLDDIIDEAIDDERLRDLRERYGETQLKEYLRPHLRQAYKENEKMLYWASIADKDKLLVPFTEYAKITGGGGGYLFTTLKEIAEYGPKLATNWQYFKKTRDYKEMLKSAGLELVSWFMPGGGVIDLLDYYIERSAKYITKEGINKFLEQHYNENKIVDMLGYDGEVSRRQRNKAA